MEERKPRVASADDARELGFVPSPPSSTAVEERVEVPHKVVDEAVIAPDPEVGPKAEENAKKGKSDADQAYDDMEKAMIEDSQTFRRERGPNFTVDHLVMEGYVEDMVSILPKLKIGFRSLQSDLHITAEEDLFDKDKPAKAYMDRVSMRKAAYAMTHRNTPIQAIDGLETWEVAEEWLKKQSRPIVNAILSAYADFEHDVDVLVNKEALKNS